jgi:hypothetical protein
VEGGRGENLLRPILSGLDGFFRNGEEGELDALCAEAWVFCGEADSA